MLSQVCQVRMCFSVAKIRPREHAHRTGSERKIFIFCFETMCHSTALAGACSADQAGLDLTVRANCLVLASPGTKACTVTPS